MEFLRKFAPYKQFYKHTDMKKFLNMKMESLLSAFLCLLGFASCTRKVGLEKPQNPTSKEEIKVDPTQKPDDSKKDGKDKSEQKENVRPAMRLLYGPPPVAFLKSEKVVDSNGLPIEPAEPLYVRK